MSDQPKTIDDLVENIRKEILFLWKNGRTDLILKAVGVPMIEELRLELAKRTLSPLLITKDYRIILTDINREVELSPIHKAVYLLFLNHPEGIEFKRLQDFKEELLSLYMKMANRIDKEKIIETVNHLVNPLDNAINEKCSRIKGIFTSIMDEYSASYYIISGHKKREFRDSDVIWYQRIKVINLPRNLVIREDVKS